MKGYSVFKRSLTIVGLLTAATVAPLATAAPASATVTQCTGVLKSYGYIVGAKSKAACSWPATAPFGSKVPDYTHCVQPLTLIGVKQSHAERACEWA
jgi:hypothetical protein